MKQAQFGGPPKHTWILPIAAILVCLHIEAATGINQDLWDPLRSY